MREEPEPSRPARDSSGSLFWRKAMVWMIALVLGLVGLDQWTKWLALTHFQGGAGLPLWPGVFELQYCENRGVAFGMLQGQRWIFIPLTLVVVALMLVLLVRSVWRHSRVFQLSALLIMAGGIGNLIDRIFRGYVIDFLYFKLIDFPIFNGADCYVTVGAVLLFVFFLFLWKEEEETPLRTALFGIGGRKAGNPHGDTDEN